MAAVGKVHTHDGIAGLAECKENGQVGRCAGMGLNVGMLCAEKAAGTLAGDLLYLIHLITTAVIAFGGVAFGIFVGQNGACGRKNGFGNDVLAGDQLDISALTGKFPGNCGGNLGIGVLKKLDAVHWCTSFWTA